MHDLGLIHYKKQVAAYDILIDEYLYAFACVFVISRASQNSFKFIGKSVLEHDISVYIGKISYGLYVYHLFVTTFFWDYISKEYKVGLQGKELMWIIYFVIALLFATVSFYFIEKPINTLKKYFSY